MEGWIKLHRQILDSPLWTDQLFTRGQAWVDLLMLANHEDNYFFVRGIKVEVKRGQIGWSQPRLSRRWKWSRTKTKNFLKFLENEQQIEASKSNVTQVITIIKWEQYQGKNQQEDSRKTTEGQQKDPNKNDKNVKKDKNVKNKTLMSQVDKSTLDPTDLTYFDIAYWFWNLIREHCIEIKMATTVIDTANWEAWVEPVRLLIENDQHTIEEIREVFKFIKNDPFWIQQMRSTAKLRKKDKNGEKYFTTLLTKSRSEKHRPSKNRNNGFQSDATAGAIASLQARLDQKS